MSQLATQNENKNRKAKSNRSKCQLRTQPSKKLADCSWTPACQRRFVNCPSAAGCGQFASKCCIAITCTHLYTTLHRFVCVLRVQTRIRMAQLWNCIKVRFVWWPNGHETKQVISNENTSNRVKTTKNKKQ